MEWKQTSKKDGSISVTLNYKSYIFNGKEREWPMDGNGNYLPDDAIEYLPSLAKKYQPAKEPQK